MDVDARIRQIDTSIAYVSNIIQHRLDYLEDQGIIDGDAMERLSHLYAELADLSLSRETLLTPVAPAVG